jgi:hypothetical protein
MLNVAEFKGFWLNLASATSRAEEMGLQFRQLGLENLYERVEGGAPAPGVASGRNLKPREWGAWLGWLRLLEHAYQSRCDLIHLLEDDTEITPGFLDLLNWYGLSPLLHRDVLIATDGFVSPDQTLIILEKLAEPSPPRQPWLVVESGLPIPCLNSLLLTPSLAGELLQRLRQRLARPGALPPIDHAIAQVAGQWLTLVPFTTGPRLDHAMEGAIRTADDQTQMLSRYVLTLLRRCLMEPPTGQRSLLAEWDQLVRQLPSQHQSKLLAGLVKLLVTQGVVHPY